MRAIASIFEVEDNGIGIAPRDQKRIFRRFYQVDQSLAARHGGCGLGLSIVDFIVRAHGGAVAVRSEVGVGSTFRVSMPLPGRAGSGGMTAVGILIVEDEPVLLRGLTDTFESRRDSRCSRRATARPASISRIEENPELILLDIMLPARQRLRGLPRHPRARAGDADRDADGQGPGGGHRPGTQSRRRRLCHQAVPDRRAGRACECVSAAEPDEGDDGLPLRRFELDLDAHKLFRDGQEVELTAKEFRLLALLREHGPDGRWRATTSSTPCGAGPSWSRRAASTAAWRRSAPRSSRIPRNPIYIQTIRDIGYRFEPGDV